MVFIGYDRYNVIVKVNASSKWKENLTEVLYPLVGTVGEEDHAGHGVPGHPPHLDLRHRHHHLPLLGLGRLHGGGAPHHLHLQLPGPCERIMFRCQRNVAITKAFNKENIVNFCKKL